MRKWAHFLHYMYDSSADLRHHPPPVNLTVLQSQPLTSNETLTDVVYAT